VATPLSSATSKHGRDEHGQVRLSDAGRLDFTLPRADRPKKPGGAWSAVAHSDDEIAERDKVEFDPSRLPPAREEFASKEATLDRQILTLDGGN
jgi:hypothetical protein